ncbi:glycosyltransferase [Alloscardovia venturai]|uniref:UDP-N-acetylglucosamine--N-acetylmuramyl-(pentapeptide) pyrophosphoryl-undecaprenol N-acetylglucosamine transferase n=1 Tax=Alloscardovia venturai TaxID=1769421 RepID=A0ABW2Y4L6_9BIFI
METSQPIHVVLAGGGTAGHVNPLLSIAQKIREIEPTACISVIGTAQGLEADLVPRAGFELDTIDKVAFPRTLNAATFTFPVRFVKQLNAVREILTRRQADIVVGVGGYASAPAYVQAHRMGIPFVIHEQNASAGMANKLGARWAHFVGLTYDDCGIKPSNDSQVMRVGLPLREVIAQRAHALEVDRAATKYTAAQELGLDPELPIVAVTGGSLGALSINTAVANASRELLSHAQVVHLTGRGKSEHVKKIVSAMAGTKVISGLGSTDGDYHVSEYFEGMDAVMAAADLVICRSGAGTVAELTALGIPAVYVPLPIGNGEQRLNALPVVEAGGGIIVPDSELSDVWIEHNVIPLLSDTDRLRAMGKAAWNYGKRDAAQFMAQKTLDIAHQYKTRA